MQTLDIILNLISQNYESDSAFEKDFKLKPKTVDSWKRGNSKAYLKKIKEISNLFHVSTDYLLGKTENPTTTNDSEVNQSPVRKEVDKLINQLNPEMLEVEFSHLRSLLEIQDKNNK